MATPSPKSPEMTAMLEKQMGRTTAIESDMCIPPPIGCGGSATDFKDTLSIKEYSISGLCQQCQDAIWN